MNEFLHSSLISALREFKAKLTSAFLLLFLLQTALVVQADVFSLWPYSKGNGPKGAGGASSPPSASLNTLFNPKQLWTEPVKINGVDLELGISFVNSSLRECLALYRRLYPKGRIRGNSNSILFEATLPNGYKRRIYLVSIRGVSPILQFSMDVPGKLPKHFQWPASLPSLPGDATPIHCMQFSKSNTTYGFFSTQVNPSTALAQMRSSLVAQGWHTVSGDSSAAAQGSGEILIHDNPHRIMIMNMAEGKDGKTSGTVYLRPLK